MNKELKVKSYGKQRKAKIAACIMLVFVGAFFVVKAIEFKRAFSVTVNSNPTPTNTMLEMDAATKASIYENGVKAELVDETGAVVYGGEFSVDGSRSGYGIYLKLTNTNPDQTVVGNVSWPDAASNGIELNLNNESASFEIEPNESWTRKVNYTVTTQNTDTDFSIATNLKIKYTYDDNFVADSDEKFQFESTIPFVAHRRTADAGLCRDGSGECDNLYYRKTQDFKIHFIESINSSKDFYYYSQMWGRKTSNMGVDFDLYINSDVITDLSQLTNNYITWQMYQGSTEATIKSVGTRMYVNGEQVSNNNSQSLTVGGITAYVGVYGSDDSHMLKSASWGGDTYPRQFSLAGPVPRNTNSDQPTVVKIEYDMTNKNNSSKKFQLTLTFNIYSYNNNDKLNVLNKLAGYSKVRENLSSSDKISAFDAAFREAYLETSTSKTSYYKLKEKSDALDSAYNDLISNMLSDKFAIKQTHQLYDNSDGLESAISESETYYRYYDSSSYTSYDLPYIDEWKDGTDKHTSEISGPINSNWKATYNYWTIDFSELQAKIDQAEEMYNSSGYSEESKAKLYQALTVAQEYIDDFNENENNINLPEFQSDVQDFIDNIDEALSFLNGTTVTLSFQTNGGTLEEENESKEVTYGSAYGDLPTPTKSGYTFTGWKVNGKDITSESIVDIYEDSNADAQWAASSITVTYTANVDDVSFTSGGNAVTNKNVTYMLKYGELPNATKTGYTFENWYLNDNVITAASVVTTQNNHEISAKMNPIHYRVSFNPNGGTGTMTNQQFVYDTAQELKENSFAKTGYTFIGWSSIPTINATSDDVEYEPGEEVENLSHVNGDQITLYAVWQAGSYTVKYNGNGNTSGTMADQSFTFGVSSKLRDNAFEKTGYDFLGWATSATSSQVEYTNKKSVKDLCGSIDCEVNLYAVWELKDILVTLDLNYSGSTSDSITVNYGGKYAGLASKNPTREGYTFGGWYTAAENGTKINSITDVTINEPQTLYAHWTPISYTVTLHKYDDITDTLSVTYDDKYTGLTTPTREGYTFGGWYTEEEYSNEITANSTVKTASNHDLYAKWNANKYNIYFNSNGGDGNMNAQVISYDQSVALSDNAYSKEGYTFAGWATTEGSSVVTYADKATVRNLSSTDNANITLYAVWTANTYTLEFDNNNGDGTMTAQVLTYDSSANIKTNTFTKVGYIFAGWDTNPNANTVVYTNSQSVINITSVENTIITLYAVWMPIPYTIQFMPNGGVDVSGEAIPYIQETYYDVDTVLIDNNFHKNGYTFIGWGANGTETTPVYENKDTVSNLTTVEGDTVSLYALWKRNEYTVTLDYKYSTDSVDKQIIFGDTFDFLDDEDVAVKASRTGYTFDGWYFDENYDPNNRITSDTIFNKTSDITIYAKWTPYPYAVKFNAVGGTGSMDNQIFDYDTAQNLTKNAFTKTGFTFVGWDISSDATTPVYTDEESANNLTTTKNGIVNLYAVWQANGYTVTLDTYGDGETTSTISVTYGQKYSSLPAEDPTLEGYIFRCWVIKPVDNVCITKDSIVEKASNHKLTGEWTPITYKLSFDANTGTGSMDDQSFDYNEQKAISDNAFTKVGYTFIGWDENPNATTPTYTNKQVVRNLTSTDEENIKLYAIWQANEYTVTLKQDNNTQNDTFITVTYDDNYPTLPTLSKDGYAFDGWYLEDSYDNKVTTSTIVATDENHNLYAKFIPNPVFIRFALNQTGVSINETGRYVEYQGLFTGVIDESSEERVVETKALPIPSKSGYTFEGWFYSADGNDPVDEANDIVNQTGMISLYAHWSESEETNYTIKFNGNRSTSGSMSNEAATTNTTIELTANTFLRTGYTFLGWSTDEDATVPTYLDGASVNNLVVGEETEVTLYALWTPCSYEVTLNANGGEVTPTTMTVTYDSYYGNIPTPTKEGYTFEGWKLNSSNVNNSTLVQTAEDHTLDADWSKNAYTIKFNGNGATSGTMSNQAFEYDEEKALTINAFARTGFDFKGWATSAGSNTVVYTDAQSVKNLATDNSTIDLYAVWEAYSYKIKFDGNGNTNTEASMEDLSMEYDEEKALTDNAFEKTGHKFLGWSTNADATTATYANKAKVKSLTTEEDITLYAIWEANSYTLHLDENYNDGEVNDTCSVTYGETYSCLYTPSARVGYNFLGWYTAKTAGTKVESTDTVSITKETTLYARWSEKTITVTYNANGGTVSKTSDDYTYGSTYEGLPTPEREGYTFKYWYYESGNTIVKVTDESTVKNENNHELIAEWDPKMYIVTFNTDGGSTISAKKVYYGEQYGAFETPVKPGYTLTGWKYNNTDITATTLVTASVDHTIVAQWTPNSYTVKFNSNDGNNNTATQEFSYGESKTLTENGFTRDGYAFVGWSTNPSSSTAEYTDKQTVSNLTSESDGVVNLYAIWKVSSFTIAFDGNGGTPSETSRTNIAYGNPYGELPTAVREGYSLDGWYTAAEGGTKITSGSIITGSATLYAHWNANTYSVTLYIDPNRQQSASVTYGEPYSLPTDVTKTGYTFAGWYTEIGYTHEIVNGTPSTIHENNTPLYAKWNAITYDVVFDGNNATSGSMENQSLKYGREEELTANAYSRTGYKFLGWSTSSTATSAELTDKQSVVNLTTNAGSEYKLYAVWEAIPYKIAFNGNGGTGSMDTINTKYDENVQLPENAFTKEGYTFTGWTAADSSYSDKATVSNLTVNANDTITLTANWVANSYQIKFDANGGTGTMATLNATYGTMVELTANAFSRTGYTFSGWAKDKNATSKTINDGDTLGNLTSENNGVVTLYAVWSGNKYQVTFDGNGGTPSKSSAEVTYGSAYGELPTATRTGYYFLGWYTEKDGGTEITKIKTVNILEAQTLYAHWSEEPYTYTFKDGDNQVFKEGQVDKYGFTIDGDYNKFTGLEIDLGDVKVLSLRRNVDYKVTEGSTIIEFTATGLAKLNTLDVNTYNVVALYSSIGKSVIGTITIKPLSVKPEGEGENSEGKDDKKENGENNNGQGEVDDNGENSQNGGNSQNDNKDSKNNQNENNTNNNNESNSKKNNKKYNPSTSDNILVSAIIGLLSLTSIGTVYFKNKKKD